jgi:hypothetical protein
MNNKLLLSNHRVLPFKCFLVGLMNMNGMRFWPPIFLTDITQFLLAHGDAALTNDMLKDYKVDKHQIRLTYMPKNI